MAMLAFTPQLRKVIDPSLRSLSGGTVRDVLETAFADTPEARGYILDEQGRLRKHVAIFLNDTKMNPKEVLDKTVTDTCEIYVMQALSGG